MEPRKMLILWDFDHTLFNVEHFKQEIARRVWQRLGEDLGITEDQVKEVFDATYPAGKYSQQEHIERLAEGIVEITGINGSDPEQVSANTRAEVEQGFTDMIRILGEAHSREEFLYESNMEIQRLMVELATGLEQAGYRAESRLLSFGEASLQEQKITAYNVTEAWGMKSVAGGVDDKLRYCRDLQGYDLVMIVNDRLDESRAMRSVLAGQNEKVYNILMMRENGKYSEEVRGAELLEDQGEALEYRVSDLRHVNQTILSLVS